MARGKVSRDDWCEGALLAIGRGGVGALSVEGLAKELGVTKGSFYWHFDNKDALLEGALARWAQVAYEDVVTALEPVTDPRERLRLLFHTALRDVGELRMEAVLTGAITDPRVAAAVAKVGALRLTYLESVYRACGVEEPAVWARVAYASYLGAVQLAAVEPSPLSDVPRDALLEVLVDRLTPGPG